MRATKGRGEIIATGWCKLREYSRSLAGPTGTTFGDKSINCSAEILAGVAGGDKVVAHLWGAASMYLQPSHQFFGSCDGEWGVGCDSLCRISQYTVEVLGLDHTGSETGSQSFFGIE